MLASGKPICLSILSDGIKGGHCHTSMNSPVVENESRGCCIVHLDWGWFLGFDLQILREQFFSYTFIFSCDGFIEGCIRLMNE